MLWCINTILFKKKVHEQWEIKNKLTNLKIIYMRLLLLASIKGSSYLKNNLFISIKKILKKKKNNRF